MRVCFLVAAHYFEKLENMLNNLQAAAQEYCTKVKNSERIYG